MAFINERFPDAISYDAIERLRHNAEAVRVRSGAIQVNNNWEFPLREFDCSHIARVKPYIDQIAAFNYAVAQGRANTFRFKAWADYKVSASEGVVVALVGDDYQMYKRYTFGSSTKDRKILFPVPGTVSVSGGGVYTINYVTGVITRTSGAAPSGFSCEFDVKCRMATDVSEFIIRARAGGDLLLGNEGITLMEER